MSYAMNIHCDGPGCDRRTAGIDFSPACECEAEAHWLYSDAKQGGWLKSAGRHYCCEACRVKDQGQLRWLKEQDEVNRV